MSISSFRRFALFSLLIVVLAAGSVSADDRSELALESRMVGVTFDSSPDHAEVRVGGKFVGTTPLNYRMAPGEHTISLTRPRYSNWTRELTIAPGISTRVTAILEELDAANQPCKSR